MATRQIPEDVAAVRAQISLLRDEEIWRYVQARSQPRIGKAFDRLRRRQHGIALPASLMGAGIIPFHPPTDTIAQADDVRAGIIVVHKDHPELLRRILEGIARTAFPSMDVVIVDNGTTDARARRLLTDCGHAVVNAPGRFNFSALCNRGAEALPDGVDVVVFLNNDIVIDDPYWLVPMVDTAMGTATGPVGCVLTYPDSTVQHCGMAIGPHGPYHPWVGTPIRQVPTRWLADGERRGVTAACLAIRRSLFQGLAGFDPLLARDYNDIDLCLRARRAGYTPMLSGQTRLVHDESRTRGRAVHPDTVGDWFVMRLRWPDELERYDEDAPGGDGRG